MTNSKLFLKMIMDNFVNFIILFKNELHSMLLKVTQCLHEIYHMKIYYIDIINNNK